MGFILIGIGLMLTIFAISLNRQNKKHSNTEPPHPKVTKIKLEK